MFSVYLTGVAAFAFFPITLEADFIDTMRRNATLEQGINLVPLRDLSIGGGSRQIIGSIVLGVPFGFGLPLMTPRTDRSLLAWGLVFAASIELIQPLMNIVYGFPYRVVDLNDLLLNFLGVAIGLMSFHLISAMYERLSPTGAGKRS